MPSACCHAFRWKTSKDPVLPLIFTETYSPSSHGTYIYNYIAAVAAWTLHSSWLPQRCHCERSHQRVSFSGPMPQDQIMWWYRFPFASICSIASRDGRGMWSFITDIKCLYMSLPKLNGEQHKAIHSVTVACSKDRCFRWERSWSWNAFLLALSWWKGPSVVKSGVRYYSFSNPGQDSIS